MKKQWHTKCRSSLAWLESEGYTAQKVTVKNNTTDDTEIINIDSDELLGPQGSSATEDEVDLLNMILYIKDKYNLSGAAYQEMAQLCKKYASPLQKEGWNSTAEHFVEHVSYALEFSNLLESGLQNLV